MQKSASLTTTLTALLLGSLAIAGCSRGGDSAAPVSPPAAAPTEAAAPALVADRIFSGGSIITMNPAQDNAEAIAVKDGRILAVGSRAEVEALQGSATERIDLAGGALLPGFIDGHSHFGQAVAAATWANVSGVPVGKMTSIADILVELQAQAERNGTRPGDWLVGYGYEADTLSDGRQATRDDLDAAFPDNPVLLIHVSFHGAVLNSEAFARIGYDENTPTPDGGIIVRRPDSNEPLGLVMETAWFPAMRAVPQPEGEGWFDNLRRAQDFYASHGITTVQDGFTDMENFVRFKQAAKRGDLYLDLVALGSFEEIAEYAAEQDQYADYNGHLKLGGIKVVSDGSPQGKTAFFSQPYLTGGPGGEQDWSGEPIVVQEQLDQLLAAIYGAGLRAWVHANADAAIDLLLNAHQKNLQLAGDDSRTVIIHSQFMRREQLDDYARYGMVPAFFSNHAYFWGDVHVKNLGVERAHFLSPMQTATKLGIHFTNHSDFMVTPLDPLFTVWSAVNRVSRSGNVIGQTERLTPLQALQAITLDGAWQNKEEDSKGSITVGKLADLVVLDKNPLTVDPTTIKDIKVVATYKEGERVFAVGGS